MPLIYKILPQVLFQQAQATQLFTGSPVDLADGFIHFSDATQLRETAAKHFAGQADLLVLTLDSAALGEALKWEPSRGGALFPHLYRALRLDEVQAIDPLPLRADGLHDFSTVFPTSSVLRD